MSKSISVASSYFVGERLVRYRRGRHSRLSDLSICDFARRKCPKHEGRRDQITLPAAEIKASVRHAVFHIPPG
jgi:hypothetical protein